MPQNPYMTVYGGAKMYAGSYVVNPYTTLYGDGGGMVPFGASEPSDAKKYKHLLKLMAHKIRILKKLRKHGGGAHAAKLKKELASVTSKIKHLKKLLADKGVDTSQAEQTAAASVSAAGDSESVQLPDGRRVPRKLLRHMRGQKGVHPGHPAHPHHPQHANYVRAQQGGDGDHMRRQQHPGMNHQSQGPISAADVQTAQAVDQSDLEQDVGADMESLSGPFAMLSGMDMNKILLYVALAGGAYYLLKKSKILKKR